MAIDLAKGDPALDVNRRRWRRPEPRAQSTDRVSPVEKAWKAEDRWLLLLVSAIALLVVAWATAILIVEDARFAVLAPRAEASVEGATALAKLFGALVLFLISTGNEGRRLRWVASGLMVLGLGGLVFGYVQQLLATPGDPDKSIYPWLVIQTEAALLFVVALFPRTPPPMTRAALLLILALFWLFSVAIVLMADTLPPLAPPRRPVYDFTSWHWTLSALPLALTIIAAVGALRHSRGGRMGGWLVVAVVLLAGSQLHNAVWPTSYSPVLATADVLRLLFAIVVVVGGILELRHIAEERAELLAAEQERSRRLDELASLREEYTAMVAHELESPLATVGILGDLLAAGHLNPESQEHMIVTLRAETAMLRSLLADLEMAASVERDDFAVRLRPVPLSAIMAEASGFAETLPGEHPLTLAIAAPLEVRADLERIGQVLHNLLGNAAKYSPPGTPIELRTSVRGERVRVEVVDNGPGIHPDDLDRIFEKFGRGREQPGVPGAGLGLYLSRFIVEAHGSELKVESMPGRGSVFSFELEVIA